MEANKRQVGGNHYKSGGLEVWDIWAYFNLDAFQSDVVSYIIRWRDKGGVQDIRKALHTCEKYAEVEEARIAGTLQQDILSTALESIHERRKKYTKRAEDNAPVGEPIEETLQKLAELTRGVGVRAPVKEEVSISILELRRWRDMLDGVSVDTLAFRLYSELNALIVRRDTDAAKGGPISEPPTGERDAPEAFVASPTTLPSDQCMLCGGRDGQHSATCARAKKETGHWCSVCHQVNSHSIVCSAADQLAGFGDNSFRDPTNTLSVTDHAPGDDMRIVASDARPQRWEVPQGYSHGPTPSGEPYAHHAPLAADQIGQHFQAKYAGEPGDDA